MHSGKGQQSPKIYERSIIKLLKSQFPKAHLQAVKIPACALVSDLIWAKGPGFGVINHEQMDAVQQVFESNSWPRNVEVTDVCETESTALSTSLDKPWSPISIQIVFASKLLNLEIRHNSLSSTQWLRRSVESWDTVRVNFMFVPSVIFKWWSDFQISVFRLSSLQSFWISK